jgi:hypothetical protein
MPSSDPGGRGASADGRLLMLSDARLAGDKVEVLIPGHGPLTPPVIRLKAVHRRDRHPVMVGHLLNSSDRAEVAKNREEVIGPGRLPRPLAPFLARKKSMWAR